MSYFPILSAPYCKGRTTIYNFPPNNWEYLSRRSKYVNLTWHCDGLWHSITLDELPHGMSRSYSKSDFPTSTDGDHLLLLSLSRSPLPRYSDVLPTVPAPSQYPAWRGSLELFSKFASTSYQGELDPFPKHASLLSFPPILQINPDIKNFLLFLNIESSPVLRSASLQIFRSSDMSRCLTRHKLLNNSITCISLDDLRLHSNDLPVLVSKNMSGVPLFLAINEACTAMSLEHTHPPASFVIHGKRWTAQKFLKSRWFSQPEVKG